MLLLLYRAKVYFERSEAGGLGACPHKRRVSAALGKIQVLPIGIVEKSNAAMIFSWTVFEISFWYSSSKGSSLITNKETSLES